MKVGFNSLNPIGLQSSVARTTKAIARSLERLATGSRVSRPADDIAGYRLGVNLDSQVRGLKQANLNVADSQNALETADTAIESQIQIVSRMREIALSAASETLNSSERESLNTELQSLLADYRRIVTTTNYNDQKLIDGSYSSKTIQMGANSGDQASMSLGNLSEQNIFTRLQGTGSFSTNQTFGSYGANDIDVADVNGDGNLDILGASVANGTVDVFLGNGHGAVTFASRMTASSLLSEVRTGDYDNDGILDVFAMDYINGAIAFFRGNGDGSFGTENTVTTGAGLGDGAASTDSFKLGDFNADGNLDIVSVGFLGNDVHYLQGDGSGGFNTVNTFESGLGLATRIQVGDINNDGKLDVIVEDSGASKTINYLGDGNGNFSLTSSQFSLSFEYQMGDFNRDGKLDFVTSAGAFYYGIGDGSFGTGPSVFASVAGKMAIGDINNDGILDIIGSSASLGRIRLGNGDGSFRTAPNISFTTTPQANALGDFNSDGVLDWAFGLGSPAAVGLSMGKGVNSYTGPMDVQTSAKATELINVLDNALEGLTRERSKAAALHSRLDFTYSANLLMTENLEEAKSRNSDVDMVLEVAELVRNQILQQSQIAVLTQANLNMKMTLQLLRTRN